MAVSYALSRNDVFDIRLILSATKHTTGRAQIIAKILDVTNRTDIDVGIGLIEPNDGQTDGVGPQISWAADYDLSQYPGTIYYDGIDRAKSILESGTKDNPIYIVELAPNPNLGVLFLENPSLKANAYLITMAGSIYKGYGDDHIDHEYNIDNNQSAAQIVYNYTDKISFAYPICTAPLDTTWNFQIYGDAYQQILESKLPIPSTMVENYEAWYENGGKNGGAYRPFSPTTATSCMYDAQAMWMASMIAENTTDGQPGKCDTMPYMKMEGLRIVVNDSGYTVDDPTPNSQIQMNFEAISWNDGDENGTYALGQYIADALTNPK